MVQPPGAPFASYILGTMHSNTEAAFSRMEKIQAFLLECSAFAAEYALEFPDDGATDPWIRIPGGRTLDQLVTPKTYARMQRAFKRYLGFDIHPYREALPLLLAQFIHERLLRPFGQVSDFPLDQYLWEFAKEQDKTLLGIETLEEQIRVLEKIPLSQQVQNLVQLSRNIGGHRRQAMRTVRLYAEGDPVKIYRSTRKKSGAVRKTLLFDRNRIMAERILRMSAIQPTFFAIGAAHLAGEKGVLRLLKHQGCLVKGV
ncbi:MAG: TraB/GumN family protein [Haliscomenobacter sp.]|nr:TraB/GumN family protein [Haliscomenobacter sp.]